MVNRKKDTSPDVSRHPWMEVQPPATRTLQVYSFDPSAGSYTGNEMTLNVPWEPLAPGPAGRKVAVIDFDAKNKCYYPPVNLDDPWLIARGGLDPSESDPRFHQQMVYAVACKTIEMFEVALGRQIHWRRADRSGGATDAENNRRKQGDIWVLNLYPHAMAEPNAYYSATAKGILFGYFIANETGQGNNLPGQRIFTCLSHDIIAHEVTHAVLDGIRTYFTEPTNPDVLAFHEAFADISALFSHFSMGSVLVSAIQRTGGRLYSSELSSVVSGNKDNPQIVAEIGQTNPLIDLAMQFGQARSSGQSLRGALGTKPNSDDILKNVNDPHFRGSILVAAVFDAYFSVYMDRAGELFRIYRAGGAVQTDELPQALAHLLAHYASETATVFFQLCARAIDYCPPVDITFGDFLRALITVATDLDPDDHDRIRPALMQAFRLRGIYPESASFFTEDALCWPRVPKGTFPPITKVVAIHPVTGKEEAMELIFGNPNGLTRAEKDINSQVLRAYAEKHRVALHLDPDLPVSVPSFHPMFRTGKDGRLRMEMVVEVIQVRPVPFDPNVPSAGTFPFRSGVTLMIEASELTTDKNGFVVSLPPQVRFIIGKPSVGEKAKQREKRQRTFAISQGQALGDTDDPNRFQANFALLHGEV